MCCIMHLLELHDRSVNLYSFLPLLSVRLLRAVLAACLQVELGNMPPGEVTRFVGEMAKYPTHFKNITLNCKCGQTDKKKQAKGDSIPTLPNAVHNRIIGGLTQVIRAGVVQEIQIGFAVRPHGMDELSNALTDNRSLMKLSFSGSCSGDEAVQVGWGPRG